MSKVLKMNNIIAKKIAGEVKKGLIINPVFVEENFYILPEDLIITLIKDHPVLIDKIKSQIKAGDIKILNMNSTLNADVLKIKALKNETIAESEVRISTRTVSWNITKHIELK